MVRKWKLTPTLGIARCRASTAATRAQSRHWSRCPAGRRVCRVVTDVFARRATGARCDCRLPLRGNGDRHGFYRTLAADTRSNDRRSGWPHIASLQLAVRCSTLARRAGVFRDGPPTPVSYRRRAGPDERYAAGPVRPAAYSSVGHGTAVRRLGRHLLTSSIQ